SILCALLNMCSRCFVAPFQTESLAVASIDSPTDSAKFSAKRESSLHPENGHRLAANVAKTNLYGFCVYQALKRTERFGAILMSQFVPENSSSHCIGSQRGRQNASKSRITFRCREDRTLGSHRAHAYDMCERHL